MAKGKHAKQTSHQRSLRGQPARRVKSRSTQTRKPHYWIFLLALIALGVFIWGIGASEHVPVIGPAATEVPAPSPAPTPEPAPVVQTVRFSASGDNLIHKPIYQQAARRATDGKAYDFSYVYQNMAEFYSQFDVNWINQESLVSDTIPPATYPCFSTPGECARALYDIGFRVFALSNNHSYDQGTKGLTATLDFWQSMPEDIVTTGLWKGPEDYGRIPVQEVNGVKIAYLAYTEHTNGIRIDLSRNPDANVIYTTETEVMQRQIAQARELADVVVVGVHWGIEYSNKESDAQKALAQQLADWGADLIVGTHPHVLQNAQWLTAADGRKSFVAYSLGNFISTQDRTPRAVGGILTVNMVKTTDADGNVSVQLEEPKIHPVITHYDSGRSNVRNYLYRDYTPELAKQHGMNAYDNTFSYDQLRKVAEDAVAAEFLSFD